MSDNEDLLGDDLGDHSLADYNLGNDEEDQLLADDYEGGSTQNVPSSLESFREPIDMVPSDYSGHGMEYGPPPITYQPVMEAECVVPNIRVEVPNITTGHSSYTPYEPQRYEPEHSVPPAMPAVPMESPQIVPSELVTSIQSEMARERFISERPVGVQRMPQIRDIPDSLDKVVIAGGYGGVRRTWKNPQFNARFPHPYRRNNAQRGNFTQRNSFPPPQQRVRPLPPPPPPPRMELEPGPLPPPPLPQIRLEINQERLMDMPPLFQPDRQMDMPRPPMDMSRPPMDMSRPHMDISRPHIDMNRPPMDMTRPPMDMTRPPMDMPRPHMDMVRPAYQFQRFAYREERPMFNHMRPQFERPMYYPRQQFYRFSPAMPQITIRQNLPLKKEPEIRMLPLPLPGQLSGNLPSSLPGGLAGKKVLINPHFKGNFQPPVEGLSMPGYIPTRIQKSPPLSPTLEIKFGPIKDIDDAAERFIAEQRNALARAAGRKFVRRSPQRYIENTTIEIENELARRPGRAGGAGGAGRAARAGRRRGAEDDLLRRQEEFIHANRAGLRRRMRSPSPPPPSPSPLPSPARSPPAPRRDPAERERRHRPAEEDSEYKRRVREQEAMRERVLLAKEARRRRNAVLYTRQLHDREKAENDKNQQIQIKAIPKLADKLVDKLVDKPGEKSPEKTVCKPSEEAIKPDTTRNTPERDWTPELEIEKSPVKKDDVVNSTCDELTPPRARAPPPPPPPRAAPEDPLAIEDELDIILEDLDEMLSDEDRKPKPMKPAPPKPKPQPVTDLRFKLPPKADGKKPQRQKIVFTEEKEEKKRREKSPPRKPVVSSTRADDSEGNERKSVKIKPKPELSTNKSRQRIVFENRGLIKPEKEKPEKMEKGFLNRRVILQRKVFAPSPSPSPSPSPFCPSPSAPSPAIFSRAVRTIGGRDTTDREGGRIVVRTDPEIEYDSGSDDVEGPLDEEVGNIAVVVNLPHGMTDARLETLAGDVQSLILDKENRSAKITFKTTSAAETFKRKFNNKMVAASRLTVTLQ